MVHSRGFVAAVDHAVGTLGIAGFGAIILPGGGFEQFLERVGVTVLKQVAGLLPAENIVGGHAPGSAGVLLLAHQKFQEKFGLVELPALFAIGKDGAECSARASAS